MLSARFGGGEVGSSGYLEEENAQSRRVPPGRPRVAHRRLIEVRARGSFDRRLGPGVAGFRACCSVCSWLDTGARPHRHSPRRGCALLGRSSGRVDDGWIGGWVN